jgi:PD-(D/E)XK endonuclease
MFGSMNPRKQGDLGELSAIEWLVSRGQPVWLPLGHSPDCDLVTRIDGRLVGVQVKTSTVVSKNRFYVTVCTRGGNQSWNGLVKLFSSERCDWLFVLVGDGRRWFIPAEAVEAGTKIVLGAEVRRIPGRTRAPAHGGTRRVIATLGPARRGSRAVKGSRL